jgi:CheY-like chemotaxis protein
MTDARKVVKVLVADDNVVNLKVASNMLLRLGHDFQTAADGREAVAAVERSMVQRQRFGAILMDVNMPDVNGIEATRQILGAWGGRAPPIIALTAAATPEDRVRCAAAGMVDHLAKPLHIAALAKVLEKWLMHSEPSKSDFAAETRGVVMDFSRLEEFREFDDLDQTMTREVVGLFVADAPRRLAAIQAAIAAGDAGALSVAAHTLKGAASNIGASALQAVCDRLEADSHQAVPRDAASRLVQLALIWAQTQVALSRWT